MADDLSPEEKRFAAAYVTTARRDARMAATHAGLALDTCSAMQYLARPGVRAEVERLSFVAKCQDGKLIDVKPLHPLNPKAPVTPVSAARRDLLAELRAKVLDNSENAATANTARNPDIITSTGEIAGSAKEVFNRTLRAQRVKASPVEPEVKPDGALENRLARMQESPALDDRGDGALYLYGKEIATPYDIKRFWTAVMNGTLTVDVHLRLQASALLGKSYGMFDAKTIERERTLDKLTPDKVEDIKAEIERTNAELQRLKGSQHHDTDETE